MNTAIAGQPLASEPVTRAHTIMESTNSDDKELLNKKLVDEDLPDLADIGKTPIAPLAQLVEAPPETEQDRGEAQILMQQRVRLSALEPPFSGQSHCLTRSCRN